MAGLAWATPTRRAMRWRPLFATASGIGIVMLALWEIGAPPIAESPAMIAVAAVFAAAALALDDPAHALLAAAPIGFGRRLAHRLAWLGPAVLVCLLGVGWVAGHSGVAPISGRMLAPAAALGSLVVVTHVLVARRRPDVAASASAMAPAVWVTLAMSTPNDAWGGTVAHLWLDRPWAVVGCAAAGVAIEIRR
jgi:hypothetical protein